jgi:hypothetical protein
MPPEQRVLRTHELLGAPAYDRSGGYLGRVADLAAQPDAEGRMRVTDVVVSPGLWGRLLGYERPEVHGPWLLERLARSVLRRGVRRLPWDEVRIGPAS